MTESYLWYLNFYIIPSEDQHSILLMNHVLKRKDQFELLGFSKIHEINNFVLIMDLNLGGYVLSKSTSKDTIQLSNGLLLEIHNKTDVPVGKFINKTKNMQEKSPQP